ncbi:hypothetical protein CspeluHIS016_0100980 [Cutaneotrichosporon spelunceum]|uniref:Sulfhydryl oxidase n=1 Tax=Cutaneotrichosporon spelunceum TaxID=1672016 RepID=A0AAD3Y972_9TREE|nr:hypothetical protein CspeluHIS016_0100980 [Cutaneotrichosporon spelunceum]
MLSIPRFARIFLVALILVTVPTAFLFYPSSSNEASADSNSLEQGGIDSDHWRAPVPPQGEFAIDAPDTNTKASDRDYKSATDPDYDVKAGKAGADDGAGHAGLYSVPQDVISGAVIMPHLGNATAKAELGRAAWRVLHLMTLRYPEHPTPDDRAALKSFFYLFSRLYPCGECAEHFQKVLKKYPPQTSSRKAASMWLCSVHNIVNERLHKPEFDCLTLNDVYDCGCNGTSSASVPLQTGAGAASSTTWLGSATD